MNNLLTSLLGKSFDEISEIVQQNNLPKFVAQQINDWLYKKHVSSFDQMLNLSKSTRALLNEKFVIGSSVPLKASESKDDTKKYLFATQDGKFIESAYIPDKERATLCVSTQVGCKMGCTFCMTGKQGFQANLTAGEIINQVRSLPERDQLSNIVYMGMGEPFDNLDNVLKSLEILTSEWGFAMSPTRITVSTIGLIPGMKSFLEKSKCHLAVSLHSPFEEDRKKLMPVEKAYPLRKVVETIKSFDFNHQRRISFEYIMFKGINDTPAHIKELTRLLNGFRCRINLIRFHAIPGIEFQPSDYSVMERFRDSLTNKGIITTIRTSRGQDIEAACGLLSTKSLSDTQNELNI